MQYITLENETDFDGWRKAARSLVLHQVNPADITWADSVRPEPPK